MEIAAVQSTDSQTLCSPHSRANAYAENFIFDRYAPSLIGREPERYDAIEVHGVRNQISDCGETTQYEVDNQFPKLFSVYVHVKDGGIECVGDFSLYQHAEQYAIELSMAYDWPTRICVPPVLRSLGLARLQ